MHLARLPAASSVLTWFNAWLDVRESIVVVLGGAGDSVLVARASASAACVSEGALAVLAAYTAVFAFAVLASALGGIARASSSAACVTERALAVETTGSTIFAFAVLVAALGGIAGASTSAAGVTERAFAILTTSGAVFAFAVLTSALG